MKDWLVYNENNKFFRVLYNNHSDWYIPTFNTEENTVVITNEILFLASITGNGSTVTATFNTTSSVCSVGDTVQLNNITTIPGFNGVFTVTSVTVNTVSWAASQTGTVNNQGILHVRDKSCAIYQENIPVTLNKYYEASAYVHASNTNARLFIELYSSTNGYLQLLSGWNKEYYDYLPSTPYVENHTSYLFSNFRRISYVFKVTNTSAAKITFSIRNHDPLGWGSIKIVRPYFSEITESKYNKLIAKYNANDLEGYNLLLTPWDASYGILQQKFFSKTDPLLGNVVGASLTADINNRITGWGFVADNYKSSFEIIADRFALSPPSHPASSVLPFVVNGTNTYLSNVFIQEAAITSLKLAGNSASFVTYWDSDYSADSGEDSADFPVDGNNYVVYDFTKPDSSPIVTTTKPQKIIVIVIANLKPLALNREALLTLKAKNDSNGIYEQQGKSLALQFESSGRINNTLVFSFTPLNTTTHKFKLELRKRVLPGGIRGTFTCIAITTMR